MDSRPYDLIYNAQLIERKQPMFVVEIMKYLPGKRLLAVGTGPLYWEMFRALEAIDADFTMLGSVPYDCIPAQFAQAKLCLFPTLEDTWGLVANEALAAGCWVITTDKAGCADDLIIRGQSGLVLPLVAKDWAYMINWSLSHWWPLQTECYLKDYTPILAAKAIQDAVDKAMEGVRYRETRITYEAE